MANLKDIRRRISSVKKTKQITSAMKLVAAAKLRRATEAAMSARPYQAKLSEVLGRVAGKTEGDAQDPLLQRREAVKRALVVVLTTDRGLCGAFNNTMLRRLTDWLGERGYEVVLKMYGRKGSDFARARGIKVNASVLAYASTPRMDLVRDLCGEAVTGFTEGTYDEVWLVYNTFVNAITQVPTFKRLLPMEIQASAGDDSDVAYEPSAEHVLSRLLPLYLRTQVLQAFLETDAGEHAARMTAMDNATRNASDVIEALTLEYNRARQAAITKEIIEIVSGAEAL
jgi:F-type H+-transporting ATPase subunit gamma